MKIYDDTILSPSSLRFFEFLAESVFRSFFVNNGSIEFEIWLPSISVIFIDNFKTLESVTTL